MNLEDNLKHALLAIVQANANADVAPFFPSFTTTKSGHQVNFSREAEQYISNAFRILGANNIPKIRYDFKEHTQLTRQSLAEIYINLRLFGLSPCAFAYLESSFIKSATKTEVVKATHASMSTYTYHLPASATGAESKSPFVLGPVTMFSRTEWLDNVDLPESAHVFAGENNHDWRESLKRAILPKSDEPLTLLTSSLYHAIQNAGAMLKITVDGYGPNLSYRMASIIGKSSLDCLSLLSGNPFSFTKHTLYTERRPPIQTHRVVETNGFLHLPGSTVSHVLAVQPFDSELLRSEYGQFIAAFQHVLHGLANASSHPHPELAGRWATALDWYGEACRDASDSIAIAKFGTSLDVLSCCGGKAPAIARMVSNLTAIPLNENVMSKGEELTLAEAIKRIYERGRSEILHGNKYDRMQSHEDLKSLASYFARYTLLSAALALANYRGPDVHDGFCKMPSAHAAASTRT
jgi:hypothetical protein